MENTTNQSTLSEQLFSQKQTKLHRWHSGVAFPHFWQVPAATEKAAYESILSENQNLDFDYFGFPWATIIDGIRNDADMVWRILKAMTQVCSSHSDQRRRVTVAQHIHATNFIDVFKACGITDIFWSHATVKQTSIDGINLHPFPLFPAQTPNEKPPENTNLTRQYLTNFIGAYSPGLYISNVRQHIFDDENRWPDVLITKRDSWHFDREVYVEQMQGLPPEAYKKQQEAKFKDEYLDAIKQSTFTLCPTGSGPNSIRIFESLALGSIPVILTKDLALLGDYQLWKNACVIEDDSVNGYRRAMSRLRTLPHSRVVEMKNAGRRLYSKVEPSSFGSIVIAKLRNNQV